LQGLSTGKDKGQENYSQHDGRSEELGIPRTENVYIHLHPLPEISGGKLYGGEAVKGFGHVSRHPSWVNGLNMSEYRITSHHEMKNV